MKLWKAALQAGSCQIEAAGHGQVLPAVQDQAAAGGVTMARVTIKRDESGNVTVIGTKPEDNGFFDWAFGKVLEGKYTEISWEPLDFCNRSNCPGFPDSSK